MGKILNKILQNKIDEESMRSMFSLLLELLDNTEIYIMPTMNPDGFSRSQPGCSAGFNLFGGQTGRNNANNQDLNRDFPKQFDERQDLDLENLMRGRQPETK